MPFYLLLLRYLLKLLCSANLLYYYAADGTAMVQQDDDIQSEGDSIQKPGNRKFNFSNELERPTGLR